MNKTFCKLQATLSSDFRGPTTIQTWMPHGVNQPSFTTVCDFCSCARDRASCVSVAPDIVTYCLCPSPTIFKMNHTISTESAPPRNRSFLRERLVPSDTRLCFVGKSAVEHLQGDIEEVILSLEITALLFPKEYSNFSKNLTHLAHHELSLPQAPISMEVSNVPATSW